MDKWGLTDKGYVRPNQAAIREELDNQQRKFFGVNINLSPKSPNGILSGILSAFFAKLYEVEEAIWHSGHPSEAKGVQLDYLATFFGVSRERPQYAIGEFIITGTPFYVVPYSRLFAKEDGTQYFLLRDVTLDGTGVGRGEISALNTGIAGDAAVGEVNIQIEPDSDIISVYNSTEMTGGANKESDESLRRRMLAAPAAIGSGTINAIYADLYALGGVTAVLVRNNNTATIVDGLPPHSNAVYVQGGDDYEIANVLMDNNVGLQFFGERYFEVADVAGEMHKVGFTRAINKDIYFVIEVTSHEDKTRLVAAVKQSVIELVGGVDADGIAHHGLQMGEDVVYTRVIGAVVSTGGVIDTVVQMGVRSQEMSTSNIPMAVTEVATTNPFLIEVIVRE